MPFWNRKVDLNVNDKMALHEAVKEGDFGAVAECIRSGADVNIQDSRGATPLHISAACGYIDIVEMLVQGGAVIDCLIKDGGTPLMAACASIRWDVVEYLLAKGADPNKTGVNGRTPLLCAIRQINDPRDQLKCISLLVEYGADVNQADTSGISPLISAAWFGNSAAATKLLELGADRTFRNGEARTAAMVAFERGHDELANHLR